MGRRKGAGGSGSSCQCERSKSGASRDEVALKAAQRGWGTTARLAVLRIADRAGVHLFGSVGAIALIYCRAQGCI